MKLRLLLILLVLSSCTQMPVDLEEDIFEAYGNQILTKSGELHNDYLYSFEEDSLYIASLMGNIRTIDNFETIYVVNEELVFFKEKLYESRQNVSPRLNGHLIVDAAQHIYLDITCDNESDVTPLIEAIDEWNSIPDCNIFFTSKYHELNPYNSDGWFVAGVQVGANSYSILYHLVSTLTSFGQVLINSGLQTHTISQSTFCLINSLTMYFGLSPNPLPIKLLHTILFFLILT